jgi:hypothetical protein
MKVIAILLLIFCLSSCVVRIGYSDDTKIGKAYIIKNGIKIGETAAVYQLINGGIYVLVNEDGTLYKGKYIP